MHKYTTLVVHTLKTCKQYNKIYPYSTTKRDLRETFHCTIKQDISYVTFLHTRVCALPFIPDKSNLLGARAIMRVYPVNTEFISVNN